MTARFYTFDPYDWPTLRRMSEGGSVRPGWVFALVLCSLLAAAMTRLRRRLDGWMVAVVVMLCAFTASFMDIGH